jgi:glycine/D-amino acid oxidase-like deaminating enzyme
MAGIEIPVKPVRRQLFVTAPFILSDHAIPLIIDFDQGWYFRQEGKGFLLSGPIDKEPSFRTTIDRHAMAETAKTPKSQAGGQACTKSRLTITLSSGQFQG